MTAKVVEQGKRWCELKQSKARTPEEDKEFQQLSDSLGKASQLMNDYFARLYKLFRAGRDANRQLANVTDETASLKEQIGNMPHTVALYTVVSKDRYSVIVISGPTMVAREYCIPAPELYGMVSPELYKTFRSGPGPADAATAAEVAAGRAQTTMGDWLAKMARGEKCRKQ